MSMSTTPLEVMIEAQPVATSVTELGESPLWDDRVGLRWLDVEGKRLLTLCADGREEAVALSETATAVALTVGPNLLAVTGRGFGWLDPTSGQVSEVAAVLSDDEVSMNDGAVDRRGRCWAGSAVRDQSQRGSLFRLEHDNATQHVYGLGMSNGIDWSPDDTVMYHVDSAERTIIAREYNVSAGTIGASKVLCSVPRAIGLPDGLTVDAEGSIWLAVWGPGEVWRIDPKTGGVTGVVTVPTPYTTSCAFGGRDLSTLYITTANYESPPGGGLLYAVDIPVRGVRPERFAGTLP